MFPGRSSRLARSARRRAFGCPPMGRIVAGQRQRHLPTALKRGIHELKDPGELARRAAGRRRPDRRGALRRRGHQAVRRGGARRGPARGCARRPRGRRGDEAAIRSCWRRWPTGGSRCRPWLVGASGVGLLQIKASMFAAGARLPFPRADLERERLLDPAHNLRVGAALLAMWDAEHVALDRALRQHAAPHGGRPLLLGRQGVGRDARGSHPDRAPPAAGDVREPAGRRCASRRWRWRSRRRWKARRAWAPAAWASIATAASGLTAASTSTPPSASRCARSPTASCSSRAST